MVDLVQIVELAQTVPVGLKLRDGVEKWILRHAFEDLLPPEILWRKKAQFDEGTGMVGVLSEVTKRWVTPDRLVALQAAYPDARLRSHEEAAYHQLLLERYPHPDAILRNMGRWAERPGS